MNRSAPEVAAALGIHPQTARYRLRQLEELFGDRLSDTEFRFAAELVLRGRSLERTPRDPS
jgi:DNA-binding PucR family transcriptional regulator